MRACRERGGYHKGVRNGLVPSLILRSSPVTSFYTSQSRCLFLRLQDERRKDEMLRRNREQDVTHVAGLARTLGPVRTSRVRFYPTMPSPQL